MLRNRLRRGAGVWACLMVLAAGVVAEGQGPEPQHGPPPTFFTPPVVTPPGAATNGAIMVYPPMMPQGVPMPPQGGPMPQLIWQSGESPEVVKPSDHWVGLQCGKMNPALAAQLGLGEDEGILVEAIVDDSPAARAGLEKYDVLVQVGERKLTKVQDLIDEVDAVKEGKLSIELIRKGKKERLEVTPEKRPETATPGGEEVDDSPGEWKDFFEHMQQWEPGKDGRPAMKFRFWRQPGTIVPDQPQPGIKLPGNVKIQIRKQGDEPAEVEVTRDGETWKVNENHLDTLPDDLRPHVERMLGKPSGAMGWPVLPPEGFKVPNPFEGHEGMFEKRFEEMNRRLDQLRDSLEDLRGKRREKAEPEKEPEPQMEAPETEAPELKPTAAEA